VSPTCVVSIGPPDGLDAMVRAVASDPGGLEEAGLEAKRCARRGFRANLGQVLVDDQGDGPLRVAVGVGPRARLGRETARVAAAAAVRALSSCGLVGFDAASFSTGGLTDGLLARSIVEGAFLGLDRFDRYRDDPGDSSAIEQLFVVAADPSHADGLRAGIEVGRVVAEAVVLARRLVNTPAGDCTPASFAAEAVALADREGLEVRVLDEADAVREGLGGLLAVGRGSVEPPRLVRLAYRPTGESGRGGTEAGGDGSSPGRPRVALVGKGITFDSGGLSLKTATSMMTMKTDMSGAAAVLATLGACRALGIEVEVIGFMALAENMPGGKATKPGDVFRARNGTTVEVLNTDAEGRLVLADALALAAEEHPDSIVDLATLTGACVTALGRSLAGLMGNDARLLAALGEAGRRAGEPSWHLPLPPPYLKLLDSEVADLANVGPPGQAGALAAGLFLERFVQDRPWAHLDIAGPARSEEDADYRRKGATGFGVRTLIELLQGYEALGGPAEMDQAATAQSA